MPFIKETNRRIYITALVISFLLIVGSIYLHLRQKTHLGRMSFNLDRDLIKPTSGVETTTWISEYEAKAFNETREHSSSEDVDDYSTVYAGHKPSISDAIIKANGEEGDNYDYVKEIMDGIEGDITKNSGNELRPLQEDSSACLRCLCMTINECRPTFCGSGNPCGLYRISKMYWIDAGKPTIAGGTTDIEDQDYLTCVNEDICASTVIREYYKRYKRDCNKDGVFDCRDQIALHLLGPSGCLTQNLSHIHANRMKDCLIESNLNYYSYNSQEDDYDFNK